MSIASEAGVKCLSAKIPEDKALLQESTENTFSTEDIEVGHLDHRKPLYLEASINQIPIKRALVDTGASVNLILLSTLQATGISERKIQGCLMEVTGFGGRGEYTAGHPAVVESRPYSFFSSFPCGQNESILSCAFGKALVAQTPIGPVHLSPVCEREIEWQDDTYSCCKVVGCASGVELPPAALNPSFLDKRVGTSPTSA